MTMISSGLGRWLMKWGAHFSYLALRKNELITILCFHKISPHKDSFYPAMHPDLFKQFCKFLNKKYTIITFRALENLKQNKSDKPLLILTFDDGFQEFMEYALPILQKENIRAILNVITNSLDNNVSYGWQGCIDAARKKSHIELRSLAKNIGFEIVSNSRNEFEENFTLGFLNFFLRLDKEQCIEFEKEYLKEDHLKLTKLLSWDDVKQLDRLGFEIGSETHNHFSLPNLNQADLHFELTHSKLRLETELNHLINIISFPFGKYNNLVLDQSKKAGYRYMLINDNRLNSANNLAHGVFDRVLIYAKTIEQLYFQTTGLQGKVSSAFHRS